MGSGKTDLVAEAGNVAKMELQMVLGRGLPVGCQRSQRCHLGKPLEVHAVEIRAALLESMVVGVGVDHLLLADEHTAPLFSAQRSFVIAARLVSMFLRFQQPHSEPQYQIQAVVRGQPQEFLEVEVTPVARAWSK